ncbi:hypothetical protein F4802DRAFT_103920 [Xylaria palmicola]|nr:hypothetical protein F4802DRAFT_103920 [Xylaria palmicola]
MSDEDASESVERDHIPFGAGRDIRFREAVNRWPGAKGPVPPPPPAMITQWCGSHPIPFKANVGCRSPKRVECVRQAWNDYQYLLDEDSQWKRCRPHGYPGLYGHSSLRPCGLPSSHEAVHGIASKGCRIPRTLFVDNNSLSRYREESTASSEAN